MCWGLSFPKWLLKAFGSHLGAVNTWISLWLEFCFQCMDLTWKFKLKCLSVLND